MANTPFLSSSDSEAADDEGLEVELSNDITSFKVRLPENL